MLIDISRALATRGFMAEIELEWLAYKAQKAISILEIGSWCGRSARAFADNTAGIVTCVDTFADNAYGDAPAEMTAKPNWLFDAFSINLCDHIANSKVIPIRLPSAQAPLVLFEQRFDLIFIDGGHHYEDVKADILNWRPFLTPDGIICGHDYAIYHPGVIQAVDEFYPQHSIVGTIWEAL